MNSNTNHIQLKDDRPKRSAFTAQCGKDMEVNMKSEHDGLTSDGCIKSNSNIAKNEQSENELSDLKKGKCRLFMMFC